MRVIAVFLARALFAASVCWPASPVAAQARDPSTVDICALMTNADFESAADVVRKAEGRGTGTTYRIARTKQDLGGITPKAYCKFVLVQTDAGGGYGGVIGLQAEKGSEFDFYRKQGDAVNGIGDEARYINGATMVRAGGLMLSVGEDTFHRPMIEEILRRAAIRAKALPAS